jgi:hypothetical protein
MKRSVSRRDVRQDPYLPWNEFIHLLAFSSLHELDPIQRPAHLVFWYDSEVQNGGHLQYFENRPAELAQETIRALVALGAAPQAAVLTSASERWMCRPRVKPRTVQEYVEESRKMEFADLDTAYYSLSPTVTGLLEKYLESSVAAFLEFIE